MAFASDRLLRSAIRNRFCQPNKSWGERLRREIEVHHVELLGRKSGKDQRNCHPDVAVTTAAQRPQSKSGLWVAETVTSWPLNSTTDTNVN